MMKKLLPLIVLLSSFAGAQINLTGQVKAHPYTISTLPAHKTGNIALVSDASGFTCSLGGGSNEIFCYDNGTSWIPVGSVGAGNVQTAPSATQTIVQPEGTTFAVDDESHVRIVTPSWNWSQSPSGTLSIGSNTITLTPCPKGVNVDNNAFYDDPYYVYIQNGGTTEPALVTGGTCSSGATSGTIIVTTTHTYSAGYTVGSATTGIQEAINDGCGHTNSPNYFRNNGCHIIVPPSGPVDPAFSYTNHHFNINADYNIYATIHFEANNSQLSGYGAILNCYQRNACIQVGDTRNSNDFGNMTVEGFGFRVPWITGITGATGTNGIWGYAFNGCAITQTTRASQVVTMSTATNCNFLPGDRVTTLFTDEARYWGDQVIVSSSSSQFTYAHPGTDLAPQITPGIAALDFSGIYDNGSSSKFINLSMVAEAQIGAFNAFFIFQDDENASIQGFNNEAISLNGSATWTGSFVQSTGNIGLNPQPAAAPVISVRDSNFTANASNCFTVLNSNGLYVFNTVCQAQGLWMFNVANQNGNFQGADFNNLYPETASTLNPGPPSTAITPFPGLGAAGGIMGQLSAIGTVTVRGNGGVQGYVGAAGTGTPGLHPFDYFIIVNDVTAGTHSNPMYAYHWDSTGSDAPIVKWPRIANGADTITYTVLRISTGMNSAASGSVSVAPYLNNCGGGSAAACGSVVVGQAQGTGLVQSFTDSAVAATSSYSFSNAVFAPAALGFWPAIGVVMGAGDLLNAESSQTITSFTANQALEVAQSCNNFGNIQGGGFLQCLWTSAQNSQANETGLLLQDGGQTGGGMIQSKGRLNFTSSPFISFAPHHIITLVDCNPAKTWNTVGMRPLADSCDTWLGLDNSGDVSLSTVGAAFGSPVSISRYISNIGDNTNWKERLTSSLETYKVPIRTVPVAFASLASCGGGLEGTTASVNDSTVATWGSTIAGSGTNHVLAYCDGTNWTVIGQ